MAESKTNALPKRDEIDSKYKWKLEHIYAGIDDWERDFSKVKEYISQIVKFKGTLGKDSNTLLECLKLSNELMSTNDRVFVYARMKKDEDNSNSTYQSLADRASALMTEAYAATSFIVPEILTIPEEKLNKYLKKTKTFSCTVSFSAKFCVKRACAFGKRRGIAGPCLRNGRISEGNFYHVQQCRH